MYRYLCIAQVLFVVSKSDGIWKGDIEEARLWENCKQSSNVSEELYQSLTTIGVDKNMTDPSGQRFIGCLVDGLKIYDTDGTVTVEVKKEISDKFKNEDEVVQALKTCAMQPSDDYEHNYQNLHCIMYARSLAIERKGIKMGSLWKKWFKG